MQSITSMPRIEIDDMRCKGCGLCTSACPPRIIVLGDKLNLQGFAVVTVTDMEQCTGCASCARICPDVAITVYR